MSNKKDQVEIFVKEKPVYCYACGEDLGHSSLLVCAECLNDECSKFAEKAKISFSQK